MLSAIKIALVDDEAIQLTYMSQLLRQAAQQLNLTIQVDAYLSGEAFLFALEDHLNWELAFLDIEMAELDGMSVAKKLRQQAPQIALVFATAYAEYAVAGYDVQALDYLLKPIKLDKVVRVLERFLAMRPEETNYLILEVAGEQMRFDLNEIVFIEAHKREILIHTQTDSFTSRISLAEVAGLIDERFVQTHRSYYVNLEFVTHLLKQAVQLSTGEAIPLSRRQAKQTQSSFIEYYRKSVFYDD